jgi:hypothetical protein
MAANMALKRAAKANRRKALVAEKRKQELIGNSPAAQALRAAQAPIRHCVMTQALFHCGMGTVILTRGATAFDLALSGFLVDTWGRGVKDAYFRRISGDALETWLARLDAESPLESVEPSYAASCCATPPLGPPPRTGLPLTAISSSLSACSAT